MGLADGQAVEQDISLQKEFCEKFDEICEPKFKKGDKVRCIYALDTDQLSQDKIYTVREYGEVSKNVRLEEVRGPWTSARFELVKEELNYSTPPTELIEKLKGTGIKFLCVTGASRSGKDTFVKNLQSYGQILHYRFGDQLKDLAHDLLPNFPSSVNEEGWSSEARQQAHWCGLNPVEVLIQCIDPLRKADPYVFIRPKLQEMLEDLALDQCEGTRCIVVSGCRTKVGLQIMEDLGATFIRLERPDLPPAPGATLDDVQVNWPVHMILENRDLGSLKDFASFINKSLNIERPEGIKCGDRVS